MEISYTNTRGDLIVQSRVTLGASFSSFASAHYFWFIYWNVVAALGIYTSIVSDQVFIACVLATMLLFYIYAAIPYSRVWQRSAEKAARGGAVKRIRLRLDEHGLHEMIENAVESFAPWSAVRSFILFQDHLLIELAGDVWANVPQSRVVEGDAAFSGLIDELRARGISERKI